MKNVGFAKRAEVAVSNSCWFHTFITHHEDPGPPPPPHTPLPSSFSSSTSPFTCHLVLEFLAVFTCMGKKKKKECCCSPCRFSRPLHMCICIYIFVTHFLALHHVLYLKSAQAEFECFQFLCILKRNCAITLSLPFGRHLRSLSFDTV